MTIITFEVETGDKTIVGTHFRLVSMAAGGGTLNTHPLNRPVRKTKSNGDGPFIYTSQEDLPSGDYALKVRLLGAGRSAELTVLDATRIEPAGDWPYSMEVPAERTERAFTQWFRT
jgi:hypothetical protein